MLSSLMASYSSCCLLFALAVIVIVSQSTYCRAQCIEFDDTDTTASNTVYRLGLEVLLQQTIDEGDVPLSIIEELCPLFRHYTMQKYTNSLYTDSSQQTRGTLIVLLLENTLELAFQHIMDQNPDNRVISSLSCDIESIAQLCYDLTRADIADQLSIAEEKQKILLPDNLSSWLRKVIPGPEERPDSRVLEILTSNLLDKSLFFNCTIPEDPQQITCIPSSIFDDFPW